MTAFFQSLGLSYEWAWTVATLAAILSFLTAHENDLVACADALQVPPATIAAASERLEGMRI